MRLASVALKARRTNKNRGIFPHNIQPLRGKSLLIPGGNLPLDINPPRGNSPLRDITSPRGSPRGNSPLNLKPPRGNSPLRNITSSTGSSPLRIITSPRGNSPLAKMTPTKGNHTFRNIPAPPSPALSMNRIIQVYVC
jgi:hypothetical protein